MTELTNVIVTNGEAIGEDVSMVICGCAVDNGELDLCPAHKSMDEAAAVTSINADYGIEATTTTKEEVSMTTETKKVSFKDLKAQAVEMGVDIKGLRSIKAVQAAMDAFVAPKEEVATEQTTMDIPEETKPEPVAIEVDYNAAITEYATDLLTLVSNGTDYNTLAKRVSVNAYSILGAQSLSGIELTEEQKAIMARHGLQGLGREKLVSLTSVAELKSMTGTQLYIFALKIGAKPKLEDIEALRAQLIQFHSKAVKPASEASRANAVSTHYKPFSSAQAVTIYPNAVIFIADGQEYTYIINPQGKGVLRHGNHSSYMNVKHLKGLLFNINTNASRKLVKALGSLRATQAGGTPVKEKNSTATKEQGTMSVRFNKEAYSIPMTWYKQFVSSIYAAGHKGSITAAMIVEAWTTRK